jgi:hypothetical protein
MYKCQVTQNIKKNMDVGTLMNIMENLKLILNNHHIISEILHYKGIFYD